MAKGKKKDEALRQAQGVKGSENPEAKTVEELAKERLEGWKRALADYENLKKDVERSRQEFARFANRKLVESLLPTLDNFHAATVHAPDVSACSAEAQASMRAWITGVEHVKKQLMNSFEQEGLEEIDVNGAFDPTVHESAGEETSDEKEGTILKVLMPGYRWQGTVIRPARVIVSMGTEEASSQKPVANSQ